MPHHRDLGYPSDAFEHEAAPVRVHERMALTSVEFLSSIATAWPAGLGGLGALAVDDRGRGAGVTPDPFAIWEALTTQLEALTRQSQVLMIFEDVHWIDPTSLEALGRAVDRVRTLGALLIVTYRTEFEPPWIGRPHVTALTINRLGRRVVADMIDRVVGNKLLPAEIRQDIIEPTDGIPLFVEEMTKTVLEAESEGDGPRCRGSVSGTSSPSKPKHGTSSTLLNVEPTSGSCSCGLMLRKHPLRSRTSFRHHITAFASANRAQ